MSKEPPPPATVRSPADVLRLVCAAALLVILILIDRLFGDTLVVFGTDLLRGLDAIPSWIVDAAIITARVLAVVVLLGGLAVTVLHARWRMLVTVTAAWNSGNSLHTRSMQSYVARYGIQGYVAGK